MTNLPWCVLLAMAVASQIPAAPPDEPGQPGDDEAKELGKRLLGETPEADDTMSRLMVRMLDAEERLARDYDPGPGTQQLQRQVLADLDLAIASAVKRGHSRETAQDAGDMRRNVSRRQRPDGSAGTASTGNDASETTAARGAVRTGKTVGPFHESRRGWGHLPARDREELIQGVQERSLEAYRAWIERYYRALAEGGGE